MRLKIFCLFIFLTNLAISQTGVSTKKVDDIVTKFNHTYNDEYSWLEKMDSEEVKNWVNEQNKLSEDNYSKVRKKVSTLNKLKIYNAETTGQVEIDTKNSKFGLITIDPKKSPHLFMKLSINSDVEEVFNPNKIYKNKNVTIDNFSVSLNKKFIANALRINGSDNLEVRFVNIDSRKVLKDSIMNVKFSNLIWNKDEGVFYKLNSNKKQFEKDSTYNVFYHKLNTNQLDDNLIYKGNSDKNLISFFNNKSMFILQDIDLSKNTAKFFYADLEKEKFELQQFHEDDDKFSIINYYKGKIYYSNKKINWGEVRSFELKNKNNDKVIIPQFYGQLLTQTTFTDDYLICTYKTENKTHLAIYDYEGKFIKKIESPIGADISYRDYDKDENELYFNIYTYTNPVKNFKIKLSDNKVKLLNPNEEIVYPAEDFEVKCISFKNRDNINVSMKIVHKKNIVLNSNNPCLLEAYGGFGIVDSSSYDNSLMNFINKGGVYAYAEIRGGGEKGTSWHIDGSGKNKRKGLNDFIDASEYLISKKYTNPQKLAITGTSNGGLVVGYALTERPDLYRLALPKVGVFDMIKFEKFTIGNYHHGEYGNPEVEEEFKLILTYSPLHKIKKDINYPTTIIFTADNDDRVPPLHSYKFAAALQNREAQKNPIYLVTKKNLGHYGGNTYQKSVEQDAEFYDYLIFYLMKQ